MDSLNTLWHESTLIAMDLECTGKYPLDGEICEMAAVKWRGGQVVDTYQTLVRPRVRMSDEVIAIHHITNEMCETAPLLGEKLGEFRRFISDGVLLAHNATFDLGFLACEFEQARLGFPGFPVLCTSLISRAINSDVANHRLPTLAAHFGISLGSLHRALDDARTCLGVALGCFEKMGREARIGDIQRVQAFPLPWERFSLEALTEREHLRTLLRATRDKREVTITYDGGSRKGEPRRVYPLGLVRNPEADFLVATDANTEAEDSKPKRFFLDKISSVKFLEMY